MLQFDREKLAWAAGLFDGEGSVTYQYVLNKDGRHTSRKMRLSIGQKRSVDEEEVPTVLAIFRNIFSVGKVSPLGKNQPSMSQYRTTSFEDTQYIYAAMWTFLGPVKKKQIIKAANEFITDQSEMIQKARWTLKRDQQLCNLYNEGLPIKEIARILHVSENSAVGRLHYGATKLKFDIVRRASGGQRATKHDLISTEDILKWLDT